MLTLNLRDIILKNGSLSALCSTQSAAYNSCNICKNDNMYPTYPTYSSHLIDRIYLNYNAYNADNDYNIYNARNADNAHNEDSANNKLPTECG